MMVYMTSDPYGALSTTIGLGSIGEDLGTADKLQLP